MRSISRAVLVVCGLLCLGLAGLAIANNAVGGDEPAMMVSPSMIVLAKVATVTVHTNIPAAAVEPGSLDLNGVAPISIYADNLGHVAAKFAVADLGLEPGEETLTLTGVVAGDDFSATDVVTVK